MGGRERGGEGCRCGNVGGGGQTREITRIDVAVQTAGKRLPVSFLFFISLYFDCCRQLTTAHAEPCYYICPLWQECPAFAC